MVTRPRHQSKELSDLIIAKGGDAVLFPVIEIADPSDSTRLVSQIDRLADFSIAVFVSANAVRAAMTFIGASRAFSNALPTTLKLAAVGNATAQTLVALGKQADIFPQNTFNSESLLAVEEMNNVAGKKIIIFRGDGGRELLATTLRERGATVEYAQCYQRVIPDNDLGLLLPQLENGDVDAIVVMSNQALQNLWQMVGIEGQQYLQNCLLIVISKRTITLAEALGFTKKPILAALASNQAVLTALGRIT